MFVKVYYLSVRLKKPEREMNQGVCAFYAREEYELKFSRCNILSIPVKKYISCESIEKQTNGKDLEYLLQSHLDEESLINVYPSGTMGAFTYFNPNQLLSISKSWQLLDKGFLNPLNKVNLKKDEMGSSSKKCQEKESVSDLPDQERKATFSEKMKETSSETSCYPLLDISILLRTSKR